MGVFHKYFWSRRTLISWISRSGRLFLQTSKELERMEIGLPERGRMVIGDIHHCHYCWGPRVDHYIFAWTITVSANWGVMQHWISTPRLRFRSWGTAETCRKRYDKVTSYKPFSHLIHLHSITPITSPIFLPYSPIPIFHYLHTHSLNPLNPFHVYLHTHSTLHLTRLIHTC